MVITDFKKGQIIHRVKPSEHGDRSFIEYAMEFLGVQSGLIFYKEVDPDIPSEKGKICRTSLYDKNDDYWGLYPLEFLAEDKQTKEL